MTGKGYYNFEIEPRDVDFTFKATVVSMCSYILKVAGLDADNNGFGVRDLNLGGCSWVLSRMSVEIYRRMDRHEKFTVRTWVNDVNRMMTTRNMEVTDAAGQRVAAAVTQWTVIDVKKRRAVDITKHVDYENAVMSEPSPIERPVKIPVFAPGETQPRKVVYSDIDFNRHVGSVKYIGWMYDMLPDEAILHKEFRRMDINYIHEARFGEILNVGLLDVGQSLFEIDLPDGQPVCRAAITWK